VVRCPTCAGWGFVGEPVELCSDCGGFCWIAEPTDDKWQGSLAKYRRGDHWQVLRRLVLERAGGQCENWPKGGHRRCDREPSQVHHLSYEHIDTEPLNELMALCARCHLLERDRHWPRPYWLRRYEASAS